MTTRREVGRMECGQQEWTQQFREDLQFYSETGYMNPQTARLCSQEPTCILRNEAKCKIQVSYLQYVAKHTAHSSTKRSQMLNRRWHGWGRMDWLQMTRMGGLKGATRSSQTDPRPVMAVYGSVRLTHPLRALRGSNFTKRSQIKKLTIVIAVGCNAGCSKIFQTKPNVGGKRGWSPYPQSNRGSCQDANNPARQPYPSGGSFRWDERPVWRGLLFQAFPLSMTASAVLLTPKEAASML